MSLVKSVKNDRDYKRFPNRVEVTFTDTNPELLFWVLDRKTQSLSSLLVERVRTTGEASKFWKNFLEPVLLRAGKLAFTEAQNGTVTGKSVLIENHVCTFDVLSKVGSEELTLRDLKLCTFCRFPGHRSDNCQEKENLKRELNYRVRKKLREDETGEKTWASEWRKQSWKLAGRCTQCGEKDHLRDNCRSRQKCCRCGSREHDSSFTLRCPTILRAFAMLKRTRSLDDFLERESTVSDLYDYVDWLNNDSQAKQKIELLPVEEEEQVYGKAHCDGHHHQQQQQQNELPPRENQNRPVKRKSPLPEGVEVASGAAPEDEAKTDYQDGSGAQEESRKNSTQKPAKKKRKKKKKPVKGWSDPEKRRKFVPVRPRRDLGQKNGGENFTAALNPEDSAAVAGSESQAPTGILLKDGRVVPVDVPTNSTRTNFPPDGSPENPSLRPTVSQQNSGSGGASTTSQLR